jgi:hypothetical protein
MRARPKKAAGALWRNLHTHPNFATVGDAYDVTDLPTSEAPYRPFSSLAVLEFLRFVEATLLGDLTSNPSARKDGGWFVRPQKVSPKGLPKRSLTAVG